MNPPAFLIILLQTLFTTCAIIMSVWASMPWLAMLALGLLGASAVIAQVVPPRWEAVWKGGVIVAWGCTLLVPASLLLVRDEGFLFDTFLDKYFATLAWLIAAFILPAGTRLLRASWMAAWKLPVMTWAFVGGLVWLVTAYLENRRGAFYVGVLIDLALLILCRLWFRLPTVAIQVVNTLILLLVGLPLADVLFHPAYRFQGHPDVRKQHYSFAVAKKDPAAFAQWWNYYLLQWKLTEKDILLPPTDGILPYRLRPNSQGTLVQSRISINSKGFRGKEIAEPKGNTYRIVALGESTTFGITLNAEDRPWPELLEQLIRERFRPERSVEVINAGDPGYALTHNLHRLAQDILPLQPDMIISYHGINGFPSLNEALPSTLGKPPPAYRQRPLRLLADGEYRLKMIAYKRQQTRKLVSPPSAVANPLALAVLNRRITWESATNLPAELF